MYVIYRDSLIWDTDQDYVRGDDGKVMTFGTSGEAIMYKHENLDQDEENVYTVIYEGGRRRAKSKN